MPEIEHPTEELLSALFEEQLPAAEVEHLLAHLDSCRICEQRMGLIEPAFARYQRCRELVAPQLPKAPQAWGDIVAAMQKAERARRTVPMPGRKRGILRPSWIGALAAAILVGAILFWPQSSSELRAETLLLKARSASPRRSPNSRLTVRTPRSTFLRPAVLSDTTPQIQEMDAIRVRFAAAHYDWSDPLSAGAYANWRAKIRHHTVEVSEEHGQSTIRTTGDEGGIAEASLTLHARDLSPVSARFVFSPQDWVEIAAAPDALAELGPLASAPGDSVVTRPESTVERSVAERELMTRLAIDRLGSGAGEPIDVDVEPDGRIVVTPYRLGELRESQLRASLQGVERVTVRSPELSERQEESPASLAGADPAIDASNAIASRAHLLSQLAERFPPETEAELSPSSRKDLREMRVRYARALEGDIDTLARVLAQSRPLRLSVSGVPDRGSVPKALLESAVAVNRTVASLYAEKAGEGSSAWRQLGEELARLQFLAHQYSQEVQR
jgi:hypothetical protein